MKQGNPRKRILNLPTGSIPQDEIPTSVVRAMKQARTNVQSQRRTDRRYRDDRELLDGETECFARHICIENTVADMVDALETSARVQQALNTLSATQQRRMRLFYYIGLNKREIAEIEGISHQNVNKSIKHALRILKKVLK